MAAAKTISCICEGVPHATVADIARLEGVTADAAAAAALTLTSSSLPPSSSAEAAAAAAADAAEAAAAADLTFDGFDIVGRGITVKPDLTRHCFKSAFRVPGTP